MIKSVLAGVALCSVLPAFAAIHLLPDGSFEGATATNGHDADFTGIDPQGWPAWSDGQAASTIYDSGFGGGGVAGSAEGLSITFIGTGKSMAPVLTVTGTDDSFGTAPDDVSATGQNEPTMLAMMGAGVLGLLGLGLRHRGDR
jgi:hypothetical protein